MRLTVHSGVAGNESVISVVTVVKRLLPPGSNLAGHIRNALSKLSGRSRLLCTFELNPRHQTGMILDFNWCKDNTLWLHSSVAAPHIHYVLVAGVTIASLGIHLPTVEADSNLANSLGLWIGLKDGFADLFVAPFKKTCGEVLVYLEQQTILGSIHYQAGF